MHILLIHQYFLEDHEGGGSRWNEMSRIWIKEGHQVTVLAGTSHYMKTASIRNKKFVQVSQNRDGVKVVRCYVSEKYHSGFFGRLWGYFSFVFSSILAGLFCAREQYEVILFTSPPLFTGITALLLSKIKGIPMSMEVRDLWPESAIDTGILKSRFLIKWSFWLENYLYQKSKKIYVLTPAFGEHLRQNKRIREDKIILAPNAADFGLVREAEMKMERITMRKSLGLDEYFVIIYVGAHGVANGLGQVLEAAEKLRGTRAFFLLIGDGAEKAQLMRDARYRQLSNVRFLVAVPKSDIFQYILAADAGLSVLIKADTFKTVYSNKTFDYLACKKPVLMAIDGISKELIEQADAGLFIEPENAEDFCRQVRRYLDNPELATMHGENGFRYAKAHFDRDTIASRYLKKL